MLLLINCVLVKFSFCCLTDCLTHSECDFDRHILASRELAQRRCAVMLARRYVQADHLPHRRWKQGDTEKHVVKNDRAPCTMRTGDTEKHVENDRAPCTMRTGDTEKHEVENDRAPCTMRTGDTEKHVENDRAPCTMRTGDTEKHKVENDRAPCTMRTGEDIYI